MRVGEVAGPVGEPLSESWCSKRATQKLFPSQNGFCGWQKFDVCIWLYDISLCPIAERCVEDLGLAMRRREHYSHTRNGWGAVEVSWLWWC